MSTAAITSGSREGDVSTALPDRLDRDVISGVHGTDATIFVDAGAGTGKTTALVDRIVTLVTDGVPVTRIAAITFTEAAAAELRHRVRTVMEERARELHDRADGGGGPAMDRIATALDDLDQATFSTLHAFAHRILSDHPIEAGLAPDFELLGEIEESAAFDLQWEAWLASFVDDDAVQPALAQMDLVGLTIPRVRRLAEALHRDLHRIPTGLPRRPTGYTPPPLDLGDVTACVDDIDHMVEHGRAASPGDKLIPRLETWARAGRELADVADDPDADRAQVFAALQAVLDAPPLGSVGAKAAWGDLDGAKAVRDRAKHLPRACDDVFAAQADHLIRTMAGWTAHFVTSWADRRRRAATLVFDDLLVLARDVLRDHAEVRARVAGGLDHLLVDEFQDTDPVQIEIAVLLGARDPDAVAASADASGSVDWAHAELRPGRLFFVGDPKQSIYRFRGADIAVYEGAKDVVVGGGGDLRHLTHNFRSVPGVIDWVNDVFADLLQPQRHAQPAYRPLTTKRPRMPDPDEGDGGVPAVRWFGGSSDDSAQDTRRLEASDVVDVVRSIVDVEYVLDHDTREPRLARAGDIAVLVRRHATARQLERCFDDAGLSLVVEARSLVFGTDEVRDLTNLLTAIEDPNDGVAVVAALRHPALGCSDADLLTWRRAGGRWWVPDDPDEDLLARLHDDHDALIGRDHPVPRGLATLARLRRDRAERTIGGVVERVIDELHLVELVLARRRPRDRWRRLRFVVDQAHDFHAGGGHLRGFVRWLRQQEEEGVRAHEHVVADPDDDAVRVTTVHAAKGLEYPVVIVLGLDTGTNKPPHDPRLLWDPDGRPELNLGTGLKTAGYARLLTGDDDVVGARTHHRHEEARLLYVATTRARDLLVVSLHHSTSDCHAAWLLERTESLDRRWSRQDIGDPPTVPVEDPAVGAPITAEQLRTFRRRHEELARAAARPRVLAATTIAAQLATARAEVDAAAVAHHDPGATAEAATAEAAPAGATHGSRDASGSPPVGARQLTLGLDEPGTSPTTDSPVDPDDDVHGDGDPRPHTAAPTPSPGPEHAMVSGDDPRSGDDGDGPGAWRRGRAGSAVGRAVHNVLQSVDLATLADLDALARSQCAVEGLPLADATLVADRVRRAAETPIVAEALAGGRFWRELHVGAPVERSGAEPITIEGFVDLLLELPGDGEGSDDLVVVDWKTDATDGRSPAEVVARYRPQAATYALALQVALGRPVSRCVFVLTGVADPDRRQVEIAGDDLSAAIADLRVALDATT